jgi:hypothetical protein
MMSLSNTKTELLNAINDESNRVIALTGMWGTGKSYLWSEIVRDTYANKPLWPLELSLFGITSIAQLKVKLWALVCASNRSAETKSKWELRNFSGFVGPKLQVVAKAALKKAGVEGASVEEFVALDLPEIIRTRFIVLDDIERANDKLTANEILGFVDEFSKLHQCRFLLIQNMQGMNEAPYWELLREKVIDYECKLQTWPSEAFNIALGKRHSHYSKYIENAVVGCELTNIRVICKVIKAVDGLLSKFPALSEPTKERIIPSIVLFSAIHYKGIYDGPTADFVLSFNVFQFEKLNSPIQKNFTMSNDAPERASKPAAPRELRWARILALLNIRSCEQFEYVVHRFFHSGLINQTEINAVLSQFELENERGFAEASLRDFWMHDKFGWKLSNAEKVAMLDNLVAQAPFLSASAVSGIPRDLGGETELQSAAEKIIQAWCIHYRSTNGISMDVQTFNSEPLHPLIETVLKEASAHEAASSDLFDACIRLGKFGEWTDKYIEKLNAAKHTEYLALLVESNATRLKDIVNSLSKIVDEVKTGNGRLKQGATQIEVAVRVIGNDETMVRLADILRRFSVGQSLKSLS